MRKRLETRDTHDEYILAMNRVARSLRHGHMEDAKQWLSIAERILDMLHRVEALHAVSEKHHAWQAEQPHRLKVLEGRARFS